ncbi:Bug family tripartite tricarboxylate transporter substrate binding protein [Pararoseomonas indoligenes]|uniref:Tripartite tricarboxylate transporter substrate binding protein n=1 Tax=Roseomonas indoligenes TaxID=2820811 RepID=A0A940N147_9PROT|nr:tripartite tricarboxylate transporter substrate binding protein [Pararoseomonas indoligenes]MBP0494852.1 tripartite tricarboxylate transporter substrate binding protein [Pararoseomonas indoligenes]
MTITRRHGLAFSLAAIPVMRTARAQPAAGWKPSRPVRLVLPFSPGGLTDILARQAAEALTPILGQSVVVENRAGAGGNLAAENVARSAPDGHSLLIATQGIIEINKALYTRLGYDPDADFVPLGMLGQQPNLLVVSAQRYPRETLAEVLSAARGRAGGLSYGSNGAGSFTHLSMELLRSRATAEMTHVPYRGSAPMLTDLVSGTLDIAFDGLGTSLPQVQSGGLRALAVSSPGRSALLPEVPAVAETLPGFDATPWYGVFAAAGTPPAILAAWEAAWQALLTGPAWARILVERQVDPLPGGRDVLIAHIAAERAVWREVVRSTGARAD